MKLSWLNLILNQSQWNQTSDKEEARQVRHVAEWEISVVRPGQYYRERERESLQNITNYKLQITNKIMVGGCRLRLRSINVSDMFHWTPRNSKIKMMFCNELRQFCCFEVVYYLANKKENYPTMTGTAEGLDNFGLWYGIFCTLKKNISIKTAKLSGKAKASA